jgi:L-threonylcarbamoyladenylate synthase
MQIFETLTDVGLVSALKQGQIGVMPTDTVYGIVCSAQNKTAVERLYAAKHRENKPGTIVAASPEQAIALGIPAKAVQRVAHLWPNPISVVLPCGDELFYLHKGLDSLAVRIPADESLRNILEQTGPLLTSSANQPGETPASNMQEAQTYFGHAVDFYVDGETSNTPVPSTLVRLNQQGQLEILRQGAGILKEGVNR